MQIYEELKARGLIAQVTNEEEIRETVNNGKAVFYIGRRLPPRGAFYGLVPDETPADGREQAHRPVGRRHRYDRRPFRPDRYAPYAYQRNH